jgi:peptide/nickel transport system ATP-binding protein
MAGSGAAHLRGDDALLTVDDLVVEFDVGRWGKLQAVAGVSLDVMKGETVGLVGESGCGKSTTGNAIVQLVQPSSGSVTFDGVRLHGARSRESREFRSRLQMIFQDPASSLNPWRRIIDVVGEPLRIWGVDDAEERRQRAGIALEKVGLDAEAVGERRARQLSGGQCQRVAIARALMLSPSLVVCDEAVSSLDVSVQAQILNLLEELKAEYGLSLLFIAHDLAVVRAISDRVVVMYLGKVCEVAPSESLHEAPRHPYTEILIGAVPRIDGDYVESSVPSKPIDVPSPLNPPSGCRFRTRCPRARELCSEVEPQIRPLGTHYVACHFPNE